jgi:hypothetical protein
MSNIIFAALLTGILASAAISRPLAPPDPDSDAMGEWIVSEKLEIRELHPGVSRLRTGDALRLGGLPLFYPGPNPSADALVIMDTGGESGDVDE